MRAGSRSGVEAVKPGGIMRALLFTVFGVFFAATAGVTYLALSPVPEQSSDSLKLVIETGSIPERQTAEAGSDAPTGALGRGTASGESENRPSLDEVIAARLQQAGQREPAEASPAGDEGAQPSDRTVAQSGPTASGAADAGNNAAASDTASATAETGFEPPATASPPPGTVSITQMLAAELNKDDEDSGGSAGTTQQTSAGPSGDASEPEPAAQPASDSTKSEGRKPPTASPQPNQRMRPRRWRAPRAARRASPLPKPRSRRSTRKSRTRPRQIRNRRIRPRPR